MFRSDRAVAWLSMTEMRRLEIVLPTELRRELADLAQELGMDSSTATRLAIRRMLNSRDELLGHGSRREAAAA
jgi:metal-responsive CopG/Arc/MetJ family transcriptional regulator